MHKTPAFVKQPKPNSLGDGILGGRRWWVTVPLVLHTPFDILNTEILHGRGTVVDDSHGVAACCLPLGDIYRIYISPSTLF